MKALTKADDRRWGRLPPLRHGLLVRAARERAGLPPKEVCRRSGISPAQLSDIERGIETLSLRRARQMAEAMLVPFDAIVQAVLQERLDAAGFSGLRVSVVRAEADTT